MLKVARHEFVADKHGDKKNRVAHLMGSAGSLYIYSAQLCSFWKCCGRILNSFLA